MSPPDVAQDGTPESAPAASPASIPPESPTVTFGVPVTFTVTIGSTSGAVPTGAVSFRDGERPLGSAPLDGAGNAPLTVSDLAVGEHEIQVD